VTVSVTLPDVPAVNVIDFPFNALVAVPFVTLHRYVAPRPASGTDAVLPTELKHTDDADVMTEDGVGLTVMTADPVRPAVTFV
jgi:hypothetical protein